MPVQVQCLRMSSLLQLAGSRDLRESKGQLVIAGLDEHVTHRQLSSM